MLKIKDNVDLKELEKYGFIEDNSYNAYIKKIIEGDKESIDYQWVSEWLVIKKENKLIKIYIDNEYYCCYTSDNTLEELYDLIQAGLVEKVNGEE